MTEVLAIVQARMGSSRLPGKILMDLAGEPMLARVVSRLRRTVLIGDVLVATTPEPSDDAVEALCRVRDWPFFRGNQNDVLDRFYQAARLRRPGAIVRVTADCPLIDPEVADHVVREFLVRRCEVDLACNVWPRRTYPRGLDTEVLSFAALERTWREDDNPAWREHVTAYLYRRPDLFRIHNVVNEEDFSYLRWTVDTPEDMVLARAIYGEFGHDRFGWREVLVAQQRHPEWAEINLHVEQKVV
jgi:spore coat polysaccharide biosynthesis protein SpsF